MLNLKMYLIVTDYSLYPEVYTLSTTTEKSVMASLKVIFARHEIPEQCFTNNGPLVFNSEFKQFAEDQDIWHSTSSPNYPQSNSLVEQSAWTIKTC